MSKNRHHHIEKMIHERTAKSMNGKPTRQNMAIWETKWFQVAEDLKKEFEAENLTNSAKYVEDVIAINMTYVSTPKTKDEKEIYRFASGWSAQREYGIVMSPQHQVEILVMGKWVLRNDKNDVVDIDKYRGDMFERYAECSMFEMESSVNA